MRKNRLAAVILTLNEEDKIKECIDSVRFADEILLIDSGSTDQTVAIAEMCGARVFFHKMDEGFAGQRNFALAATDAEWVFYIDADERITPSASEEIRRIVDEGQRYGYEIKRMNIVFGKMLQYGGHSPDYVARLYPRDAVSWEGLVHEHPNLTVPVKRLRHPMHHYTYTSWKRYFEKFDQYTTLMAQKMLEKGKRARLTDITLRPVYGFIRFYILKAGWRDGRVGFIFAMLHGIYTMMKYVKLYDMQEGRFLK